MPDVPDTDFSGGRFAKCTINGSSGMIPKEVVLHVLAGLANDDFCVFVSVPTGPLLIGCHNETNEGSETWGDVALTIPPYAMASGQDVTVTILATGNAWNGFTTYGQVAVDYITVKGE
jgi:hypothetical protein